MKTDLKLNLKRLDAISIAKLDVSQIRDFLVTLKSRARALVEESAELEEKSKKMLAEGDPDVLVFARTRTIRLRKDMETIRDLEERLQNKLQQQLIKNKMEQLLGSPARLVALDMIIMLLITLVLALLVYDSIAGVDALRHRWLTSDNIFIIDTVCCAIFMSEFIFRLYCADSKRYVWRHHWVDFLTSIPIPGEAQLARFGRIARLARFARVMRMLRFLRFLRIFFLLWRGMDQLQHVIDVKLMKKTLRWSILITLTGAFLVYQLEGIDITKIDGQMVEGNSVSSYPLALWWSFTTVVTGGFGDIHNPYSISGQILTAFLVITGMILIGVFTATLTSLFVGEQAEELEKLQEGMTAKMEELTCRFNDFTDAHDGENSSDGSSSD